MKPSKFNQKLKQKLQIISITNKQTVKEFVQHPERLSSIPSNTKHSLLTVVVTNKSQMFNKKRFEC